ncbi:hypothetical protein FJ651_15375 [Paucihalobacter ruber]|uniref:Lipoprotein n=1 Tax=Paucihalobacter ruber TaxID=2567861 RepID=A0A506PCJ7_9FLAO|nr:hypothetical protein [Paucihalobacter ruber]TPV31165.1 hypothetical protein FJ651_15375 [Paucihalobacter ruber]
MKIRPQYFLFLFFIFLIVSCVSKSNEVAEYEIISEVLNHSYGNETDNENGLNWIDTSKPYKSLLILNHTNLIEVDLEIINQYLTFNNITDFSIDDFNEKRDWDVSQIKGYKRYKLEIMKNQSVESPHIGMVQISAISFNKEYNKALVYTSFFCAGNGDCGEGLIFHLTKDNNWKIEKVEIMWVS